MTTSGPELDSMASSETLGAPTRRRVMIYCPEALVRPHFIFLQFIGRILADFGHEVFVSYCDRLFPRCVAKDSILLPGGLPAGYGEQVCTACVGAFSDLVRHADLPVFAVHEAVPPQVIERVRELISAVPDDQLPRFAYDDIDFGKVCLADLLVARKILLDTALEPEHHAYLREYLVSALASYVGMVQFLPAAGFTDVLIYGAYAGNMCVAYAAEKVGANWRMLHTIGHLGFDRRRFYAAQSELVPFLGKLVEYWPCWRDTPLKQAEVVEVADDVLWRLCAVSIGIYSPAKTQDNDVFRALDLSPGRRTLLACTSSLDELNFLELRADIRGGSAASVREPFANQIEWLTFLASETGKRSDWQLVIRIHPREDANKREGVRSRHLDLLRQALSDLPPNVRVVWPTDRISTYDILEIADLALVWMTNVGLEAGRLAVPVLRAQLTFPNYPVSDFVFSAPDPAAFLNLIHDALTWEPSFDRLVKAWRFYAYSRFFCAFDARDAAPQVEMESLPPYRRPKSAADIVHGLLGDSQIWESTRRSPDFWQDRSVEAETVAIKKQLARLFHVLMTGQSPQGDVRLALDPTAERVGADVPNGTVAISEHQCRYAWGGRVYSRFSPMCERLAVLATS